jgi:hypothetical protein
MGKAGAHAAGGMRARFVLQGAQAGIAFVSGPGIKCPPLYTSTSNSTATISGCTVATLKREMNCL